MLLCDFQSFIQGSTTTPLIGIRLTMVIVLLNQFLLIIRVKFSQRFN